MHSPKRRRCEMAYISDCVVWNTCSSNDSAVANARPPVSSPSLRRFGIAFIPRSVILTLYLVLNTGWMGVLGRDPAQGLGVPDVKH